MDNINFVKAEKLDVIKNKIVCSFSAAGEVKEFLNNNLEMFIEYDENMEKIPKSILIIPFVANLMPLIWLTDSTLWIEEIDRSYYDSIPKIRSVYQDMYRGCKLQGRIISAKVLENKYEFKRDAIQLFSGGLDAITTNIRIKKEKPILVNIYGWNNKSVEYSDVFESDKKNISKYAQNKETNVNFIQSNFATFILAEKVNKKFAKKLKDSWWHGLQHGGSFIGHAIPIAYKNSAKKIYISSSNYLGGKRISCSSDPAVDIEIKYASGGVVHDGFELNRQEKMKILVDDIKNNIPYELRVCSFKEKNCCTCEKCFRTILSLVAEGMSKAEMKNIGFDIQTENLKNYFEMYMEKNIQFFGVEFESGIYWNDTKKRMKENYENIKEKEFCEWFFSYNFLGKRKKAIIKYRIKNFIPILKRKVFKRKL